jgi:hypothetical protein
LPIALYTDRAHWAFHTPKVGGPIDRTHPTQVGRALAHLGIDHIGADSPQARGRSERLNRTVQRRLVNELHLAGATTRAAANAYLTERFIAGYNEEFAHPPADPTPAFVPLHGVELDGILCDQEARTVGQDNVVTLDEIPLQLDKQPGQPCRACLRQRAPRLPGAETGPNSAEPVVGRDVIEPPTPGFSGVCSTRRDNTIRRDS